MTGAERKAIMDMVTAINANFAMQDEAEVNKINEKFIKRFKVDVTRKPDYILKLLETAYRERNSTDVECSLIVAYRYSLFSQEYVSILVRLIESDWHYKHEDIAFALQKLKSPKAVECLYRTALKRFPYLDYDDAYALAVKCIWALGDTNTAESREKLKLLSKSDNEIIRENAIKQIERYQ